PPIVASGCPLTTQQEGQQHGDHCSLDPRGSARGRPDRPAGPAATQRAVTLAGTRRIDLQRSAASSLRRWRRRNGTTSATAPTTACRAVARTGFALPFASFVGDKRC